MAYNDLLPPLLNASQAAFSTDNYTINYSCPSALNQGNVGHVQVRIVNVHDNRSIVKTSKYPDGIIYKTVNRSQTTNKIIDKSVYIDKETDIVGWTDGAYYKVQLRFGKSSILWSSLANFTRWKQEQIQNNAFSEWSTVMIIKKIATPEVKVLNATVRSEGGTSSTAYRELTTTPLFVGGYRIRNNSNEKVLQYRFSLYTASGYELEEAPIETSGWILNNNLDSSVYDDTNLASLLNTTNTDSDWITKNTEDIYDISYYRFHTLLTNNNDYVVFYEIITENGYQSTIENGGLYRFKVTEQYLSGLEDLTLLVEDSLAECHEDGVLKIALKTTNNFSLTGHYVLSRVDEKSNYTSAEIVKHFFFNDIAYPETTYPNGKVIFDDLTIESNVKYKYFIQRENSKHIRTEPLYERGAANIETAPAHSIDFEYAYLVADDVQLKLKFDNTMASFKHTRLEAKQDTIGSQYPTIFKNSYANYAEFPINGLLTLQSDEYNHFFRLNTVTETEGLYYKDELILPASKYSYLVSGKAAERKTEHGGVYIDDQQQLTVNKYNTNLTDLNIVIERKFREKAEEFLLNTDYKLYRSPTEGNIVVTLTNVTLTPKQELGRMIFSFSAMAYETLDYTIDNLSTFGIIDLDEPDEDEQMVLETNTFVGQIAGLYRGQEDPVKMIEDGIDKYFDTDTDSQPVNLVDLIKEQNEQIVSGSEGEVWEYNVKSIKGIWVEQYPKIDLTLTILALEAQKAELENNEHRTQEEELLYKQVVKDLKYNEHLQYTIEHSYLYPRVSLVLNGSQEIYLGLNKFYVLDGIKVESLVLRYSGAVLINYVCDAQLVESASRTTTAVTVHRIHGQLAGVFTNTKNLLDIYQYDRGDELKVFNLNDKPAYLGGLYQTLDVYSAIQEATKKYTEQAILELDLPYYDEELGEWTNDLENGSQYYSFGQIVALSIEADENLPFYINNNLEYVGPTEKYVLDPATQTISSLSFKVPTFAIVDFICTATVTEKGGVS